MVKQQFSVPLTLFVFFATFALCAQAGELGPLRHALGLDGVFLDLANELPGFGGYFFDDNGDLNVYLTDVAQEAAARARLSEVARNRPQRWRQPWSRPAQIIIRHAQFDFPQLDAIRLRLETEIGGWDGVNIFDTNEASNRVIAGVRDEETRQRVLAHVAALDLPRNAYTIDVVPDPSYASTLRDTGVRPIVGGLRVEYTTADQVTHDCTLGVNVVYTNTPQGIPPTAGFFTASHCSQTQGVTDYIEYRQGTQAPPAAAIGVETYDPPMFNWRTNPYWCPYQNDAYVCRHSDVTFVAYNQGVDKLQGYFAKTLFPGIGLNQPGSIDLDTSRFVADSTIFPATGWTLDKVGQRTGWTEGTVRNTCVDVPIFSPGLNKWVYILCAAEVDAYAFEGDSGAPVFYIKPNNVVAFSGIVFGKTGRGSLYFSSVDRIPYDFGPELRWWNYVP